MPIDLQRTGDVPGVVQEHVLVAFQDTDVRIVEMVGQPARGDPGRTVVDIPLSPTCSRLVQLR